jgi:hypothetical protein
MLIARVVPAVRLHVASKAATAWDGTVWIGNRAGNGSTQTACHLAVQLLAPLAAHIAPHAHFTAADNRAPEWLQQILGDNAEKLLALLDALSREPISATLRESRWTAE